MRGFKGCVCAVLIIMMLCLTGCLAYTPEIGLNDANDGISLTRNVEITDATGMAELMVAYGGDTTKVVNTGTSYTYTDTITVPFNTTGELEGYYGFKSVSAEVISDTEVKLSGTRWDLLDYANITQAKKTKVRVVDNANIFKNKDIRSKYIFGTDIDFVFFAYPSITDGSASVADFGNNLYQGLTDKAPNAVICTVVTTQGVDINFIGEAAKFSEAGRQKLFDDLNKYLGSGTIDCDGALLAIIDDTYADLRNNFASVPSDYSGIPQLKINGAISVNGVETDTMPLFVDTAAESATFDIRINRAVAGGTSEAIVTDTTGNVGGDGGDTPVDNPNAPVTLDLKTILIVLIVVAIVIVIIVMVVKKLANKEVDVAQNDIAQRNVNKAVRTVNSNHGGKNTKVPKQPQQQFKTPDPRQDMQNMQQSIARANQGLDMMAPMGGNSPFPQQQGNNSPFNNGGMQSNTPFNNGNNVVGHPQNQFAPQQVQGNNSQNPSFNRGNMNNSPFNNNGQGAQGNNAFGGAKQPVFNAGANGLQPGVSLESLSSLEQGSDDDWD